MLVLNILFIHDLLVHHDVLKRNTPKGNPVSMDDDLAPGEEQQQTYTYRSRTITMGPESKKVHIRLKSSKERAEIYVDGQEVHGSPEQQQQRGIHIAVLNQATGYVMSIRVFDTYSSEDTTLVMISFLNSLADGRILCFAVADEGSFNLKDTGKNALSALGSKLAKSFGWRDTWVFLTQKMGEAYIEDLNKAPDTSTWASPVEVSKIIQTSKLVKLCDWPNTPQNARRTEFCSKFEGYGRLCDCSNPISLDSTFGSFSPNNVANVPVAVIASNRGPYLFRMLRQLMATPGASPSMTTVFIDGYFNEPKAVAELFDVKAVQQQPKSSRNGRISQHYKASLTAIFDLYPDAEYAIIVEEDLDVSPDFFSYFSQTLYLLKEDPSLYCISAWNDQGYEHSAIDPTLLYRVETMPGLGWVLSRKLYKEELEPQWPGPEKLWDWDMWMRTDYIRKGRECVIPDISRTFHFGKSGTNMNPYFHDRYFKKHILNRKGNAILNNVDQLKKDNYETLINSLLRSAIVLDHNKPTNSEDFIPATVGKTYVMYVSKTEWKDWDSWIVLAGHWKLWDLDARGFHRGLWRLWLKNNSILVVGCPFSVYCHFKPENITPIKLMKSKRT